MLEIASYLVLEFAGAVDAFPAPSGTRRIASLDHETLDYAMEDGVVVISGGGEGREVVPRARRGSVVSGLPANP